MKTLPGLLLPVALAIAGAGCAQAPREAGSPGRGWIVADDGAARDVLHTCSRESPDRDGKLPRWTPTPAQVAELERALPTLSSSVAAPDRYRRQYVGIVRDGVRLIYVNAWQDDLGEDFDPQRMAVVGCDGGERFWGALWDPAARAFSEFRANGAL